MHPPNKTKGGGFSLANNHAQRGPKTASVNIMIPTIAEGVLLAPIVIKIKPRPTWNAPAKKPKNISWAEIRIFEEKKYPIIKAPIPAKNWSGIMSVLGNFLTIKIRVANEIGIIKATMFPSNWPGDKLLPTIKIIPENAKIIDARVSFEIFSFRNI